MAETGTVFTGVHAGVVGSGTVSQRDALWLYDKSPANRTLNVTNIGDITINVAISGAGSQLPSKAWGSLPIPVGSSVVLSAIPGQESKFWSASWTVLEP
jgi:hypothetical protein